jgi:hypothetical protein
VHTIGAAHTTFGITIDGRAATLDHLLSTHRDAPLGIVVRSALGAVGASAVVMAVVCDFYDRHRADVQALAPGELLYPEHHLFHVGRARGDYAWFDVWPPHKEVVVADDRVAIATALLERRITRLLVEDSGPRAAAVPDAVPMLAELDASVVTCLAFSPTGRTAGADVRIVSNPSVEQWVSWTIDPERAVGETDRPSARLPDRLTRRNEVTDDERAVARAARAALIVDSRPVETYRRISTAEAISLL